VLVLPRSA